MRSYGAILAGALIVSIPNLIFFLERPGDFLSRGSYVLRGTGGDWVVNMIRAAFMPFYYPESYLRNGNFDFDRVSAALTLSGFNSVHPVLAIALIVGLTRVKRWIARPVAAYLVAVWLTAIPTLGFAGPSLTRLLILLPVYLVFAALGIGFIFEKRAALWIPVLLVMLFAIATSTPRRPAKTSKRIPTISTPPPPPSARPPMLWVLRANASSQSYPGTATW